MVAQPRDLMDLGGGDAHPMLRRLVHRQIAADEVVHASRLGILQRQNGVAFAFDQRADRTGQFWRHQ